MEQLITASLKALNLMKESEQTVAEFYLLCSERYSDNHTFWAGLAREEMAHARVIARLIELVSIHPSEFTLGKATPLEAIKSFIGRTNSSIESLRSGELPEEKALLMAYHIENTLIELQYADVVTTSNEDYKALLSQVIFDTLKHREKVVEKNKELKDLATARKKSP